MARLREHEPHGSEVLRFAPVSDAPALGRLFFRRASSGVTIASHAFAMRRGPARACLGSEFLSSGRFGSRWACYRSAILAAHSGRVFRTIGVTPYGVLTNGRPRVFGTVFAFNNLQQSIPSVRFRQLPTTRLAVCDFHETMI